jgi:hypothetical protein
MVSVMKSPRLLLLLALSVAAPTFAQDTAAPRAEDLRDVMSARAYGMGGAFRALGLGGEAVLGNPAAMAVFPTYRIEVSGAWDYAQKDANFGATLMDANTSALAAGLDYHLVSLGRGPERATAHLATLAFATPLAQGLYIGASTHYLSLNGARQGSATTVDAGIILRLGESLAVGVSGHNLVDIDNDVEEMTRYYSAHAGYVAGELAIAVDARGDFVTGGTSTFTYSAGLEYLLGQAFPVRVGYTYDGFTGGSQLGLGLGIVAQGTGIDLAYRHDFGEEKGRLVALTIKVQIF